MPKVTGGYLAFDEQIIVGPGRPTNPIAPGGERPNNALPGIEGPVDPGYGIELPPVINGGPPVYIDNGLPVPPTYPVDPDYDLPTIPSVWPRPPYASTQPLPPGGSGGEGGSGERPSNPIAYPPVRPSLPIYYPPESGQELPLPPGSVWPPLPPSVTGLIMALVWIVGVGYRWTVIDTSLKPTHPIAPPTTVPSHPIAPGGERPSTQPVPPGGGGGGGGKPTKPVPPTEPKPA
jgi:hypothetical protein